MLTVSESNIQPTDTVTPKPIVHKIFEPETHKTRSPWKTVDNQNWKLDQPEKVIVPSQTDALITLNQADSLSIAQPSKPEFESAIKLLDLQGRRIILPKDIENAYKKLALKYHPDKGGDTLLFQDLGKAKEILLSAAEHNPATPGQISGMQVPLQITYKPTDFVDKGLTNFPSKPSDQLPDIGKQKQPLKASGATDFEFKPTLKPRSDLTKGPKQKSESPEKVTRPSKGFDSKDFSRDTSPGKTMRRSLPDKTTNLNLPEAQTGTPNFNSPEFNRIKEDIDNNKNLEFTNNSIQQALETYKITPQEAEELTNLLKQKKLSNIRVRRLQPTKIVAEQTKSLTAETKAVIKKAEDIVKNLSPQEEWELKNREKILQQEQEKLKTIAEELTKLPDNEQSERENLEAQQEFANYNLQHKLEDFQKELKRLQQEQEKQIEQEAERQAAIQRKQIEEQLAAEKTQPLPDNEIQKISQKYNDFFEDLYINWKKEHPSATKADFIDFELGLSDKNPGTFDFNQAIAEKLPINFKEYNQATQDEIILHLERNFFNLFGQYRKSKIEWEDTRKTEFINKRIKYKRSYITKKVQELLLKNGINESNNPVIYDEVIDRIIPKDLSKPPLELDEEQINDIIHDTFTKHNLSIKKNQIEKLQKLLLFYQPKSSKINAENVFSQHFKKTRSDIFNALQRLQFQETPLNQSYFEKFEKLYKELKTKK